MQRSESNLLTRSDTLFGVCEAIGQDFGFNPFFLRVSLAVLLLWNPAIVIGTYFAAGIVVAVSRLLFPHPRAAATVPMAPASAMDQEDEPADRYAMAA